MRFVLSAIFLVATITCAAQTIPDTTENACIFPTEIIPQFPGGLPEMKSFIARNLKHPQGSMEVSGRVFVQFTVETDGSLTNVKTIKGIHPLFDAEAERVVKLFPKWIPGEMTGVKVPTRMVVPIAFNNRKKEK